MKTVKDLLIVALLGCLAFMTYVQEDDCMTLKQRTFYQEGGLFNVHNRLIKVEGGLSVGCSLNEMRDRTAMLSLKKKYKAGGFGVFVSPTALLTAKHVVEGLVGNIIVKTAGGFTFKSIEVIKDKDDDIALVIIDKPYGLFAELDNRPVQLGDGLVCIGDPFAIGTRDRLTVTFARVANERDENSFIYDGFCWHGYSGGPVFRGNLLVGITYARHSGGQAMGFATPIDRIDQKILDRFR